MLRAGAVGRPKGMGWGGSWEGVSGWGTHVNPWLIHVNVWQKPLQHCKVISLQLIKINEEKKKKTKTVIKDKEEHYVMIKGVIQQEDIKFANNYAFNVVAPNHINKAYIKRCNRRN